MPILELMRRMACCRFVELLWHLSAHALREVHRRTFLSDVATNPLPAPLAEIVGHNLHAASLLGVTKVHDMILNSTEKYPYKRWTFTFFGVHNIELLSSNSKCLLVREWFGCIEQFSCLVSFWSMLEGSVEV